MQKLALLLAASAAGLAWPAAARAQVSDAERAAARELFKEGDELQRAGKFAEALDKFQRAQQVFSAPTNMLRIAECDAALGRLVESSESYRAVVRTPLPAGSPPAFQSAVDQARGELAQVEPRVPRIVVQVEPASVPNEQMQIDGQNVPAALIGEAIPLDPGTHRVLVFAPGYASAEQPVTLKERDSKTVPVTLRPIAGVSYAPGAPGGPPPSPPPADGAAPPGGANIPPPPPPVEGATTAPEKKSRTGLLFGLHLGAELPTGTIPLPTTSTTPNVDANNVSGDGLAYGLDGGLRFARNWFVGLTLDHASLGRGHDPTQIQTGTRQVSSDTTMLGVELAIIGNPDRTSFYGEIGLDERWYGFTYTDANGHANSNSYNSGEVLLGLGIWIPVGHAIRLLPEATAGLGVFNAPGASDSSTTGTSNSSGGQSHAFFMLGLGGFYGIDL